MARSSGPQRSIAAAFHLQITAIDPRFLCTADLPRRPVIQQSLRGLDQRTSGKPSASSSAREPLSDVIRRNYETEGHRFESCRARFSDRLQSSMNIGIAQLLPNNPASPPKRLRSTNRMDIGGLTIAQLSRGIEMSKGIAGTLMGQNHRAVGETGSFGAHSRRSQVRPSWQEIGSGQARSTANATRPDGVAVLLSGYYHRRVDRAQADPP